MRDESLRESPGEAIWRWKENIDNLSSGAHVVHRTAKQREWLLYLQRWKMHVGSLQNYCFSIIVKYANLWCSSSCSLSSLMVGGKFLFSLALSSIIFRFYRFLGVVYVPKVGSLWQSKALLTGGQNQWLKLVMSPASREKHFHRNEVTLAIKQFFFF